MIHPQLNLGIIIFVMDVRFDGYRGEGGGVAEGLVKRILFVLL